MGRIRRGSGGGCAFVVITVLLVVICSPVYSDGPPKDFTLVRPKHLKYQSYRAKQQNESSAEELDKRHRHKKNRSEELESEESRTSPQEEKGRKFANASAEGAATNLKRSLLPGHAFAEDPKTARFGPLGIQKSPPDLQFGLAFTVPFVSLSTDKLINTFSGKSYGGHNDVSNILKLNLGGLIAAVIVGIGAFFLVPGLLHAGKFGGGGGGLGWGGSLLDSIFPQGIPGFLENILGGHGHFGHHGGSEGWGNDDHLVNRPFGYNDYYEYNGIHNHNRKDTSAVLREKSTRREGRSDGKNGTIPHEGPPEVLGLLVSSVSKYAKKYVATAQSCIQLQICRKAAAAKTAPKDKKEKKERKVDDDQIDFLGLIESLSDNELVRESPLSQEIKKAHEHGETTGECQKYEKPECK